jgi:hypothetical protein
LGTSEINAAKKRLLAMGQPDAFRFLGELQAIFTILSLEEVGPTAFELIREALADFAAYDELVAQNQARWHYDRDNAPEETSLGLDDVYGYAAGRAVKR